MSAALIGKIHVAKKQLGLDDATYRALLSRLTGKDSSKDLTSRQMSLVLAEMERLGFKPIPTKGKKPVKITRTREQADDEQHRKIWALWLDLAAEGIISEASEAGLAGFVKRQTGVEALQWLSSRQASAVIEALKGWRARILKQRAAR